MSAPTSHWAEFDAAYAKACESSLPADWLLAAMAAQRARRDLPAGPSGVTAPGGWSGETWAAWLRDRASQFDPHTTGATFEGLAAWMERLPQPEAGADDTRRMDWLEDVAKVYWVTVQTQPNGEHIFAGQGKALREAIDDDMAKRSATDRREG